MRIVVFASGSEYSRIIFEAIADHHQVLAAVRPASRGRVPQRWIRAVRIWRSQRGLRVAAQRHGVPVIAYHSPKDGKFIESIRSIGADLIVIAAFPYVVPPNICSLARLGAVNVHPSLLPRHRGADPLFWTFFHDESVTGSTVHWVVDALDAGDIILQESIAVPRGIRYDQLTREVAWVGAKLVVAAIDDIASGRAPRTPQDEAASTTESVPSAGGWAIDFQTWGAERLWHFLHAVSRSHAYAVRRVLPLSEAIDFTIAPSSRPPGTVERDADAIRIYTYDGWVTAQALR